MIKIFAFALAFLASYIGVEKFRRWTTKKKIIDVPNERSSHVAPTPRGGGLVFVFIALIFYAADGLRWGSSFRWSYFAGAVAIAVISWLDDLFSVKTLHRFAVHAIAALLVIYENGFWQEVTVPHFGVVSFGALGAILTFCWIVGLTNAYNFMDGIDGLAAAQASIAGIGWLIIGTLLGSEDTAVYAGVIAFSCLGFLIHNREPAKIFMGDVGSAFLGYTFAVLPILAKTENSSIIERDAVFPLIGILLIWFFFFDASYTFVVRLLKRRRVWQAHREHLYQKMVIEGYRHKSVTMIYSLFTLIVLLATINAVVNGNTYLAYALTGAIVQSFILIELSGTRKKFEQFRQNRKNRSRRFFKTKKNAGE